MATYIDRELYDLALRLQTIRDAKAALEKEERQLISNIKSKADGATELTIPNPDGQPNTYSYKLTISDATRKTLDRELLLENGVKPSTIAASTKTSSYSIVKIKKLEDSTNA